MNKVNRVDFRGQQIYVGIDVHKKNWGVSIYTEHFEHKTFSQPSEAGVLLRYLHCNFPFGEYHCVYEAGFSGFWLYDRLKEAGIDCMVVNPSDVPTKDKERVCKSDRVDCRKLARSLRSGEIEGIYVPSKAKREDRGLLRTRRSMVKKQTRCKNQIRSILYFHGIDIPDRFTESSWSNRFIKWVEDIEMNGVSGNITLKVHLEELKHLRLIIGRLNKEIRELSRSIEYNKEVSLLKTVPGISTITAMTLLTELCDISRFESLDKLCSYVGLIPDTKSSGEKDYNGEITGRRNPVLRGLLIENAWVAVRKDPALMVVFNRLSKRMKKSRAIIQITRKLLNRIRYVLKNREEYVPAVIQ